MRHDLNLAILMALGLANYNPAFGQEVVSFQLEEVVVTARKRQENLQDTPLSITVFSSADIAARNMSDLSEIDSYAPNLVFDQGTGSTGNSTTSQIYLRGVGQADFLFTTEPGVGIYVDDVYLPRSIGSLMSLLDVERIEVLRGPQGTLFGRNSVGGAINITTKRPTADTTGSISVGLGRFDKVVAAGDISGSLIEDKLLGKLSISYEDKDGYVERINDNTTLGAVSAVSGRGQILWDASDDIEVLFSADYARRRDAAAPSTLINVDSLGGTNLLGSWNALVAPVLGEGSVYDARYISADPFVSEGTGPNFSNLDAWGLSATVNWDLGELHLKSVTAYRSNESEFATDNDHSPIAYYEQGVVDDQSQFSQEIQLGGDLFDDRLQWLLGAMYFQENGNNVYNISFAPGLFTALESLPPGLIPGLGGVGNPFHVGLDFVADIYSDVENTSYSVFAHGVYDVSEKLSFSLGARYTVDEKDFVSRLDRLTAGVTTHNVAIADDWSAFTPKASLEYQWREDVMAYLSASRGFKSGGFNGRPTTAFVASRPFAPEYVWTYEAGVKSSWLGNRVRINAAYFYSDYSDMQILSVASDPQGGIVAVVENAGEATIKGMEFELSAVVAQGLKVDASVGYLDAGYTALDNVVTQIELTDSLVKTPRWSASFGVQYNMPLGSLGELSLRGDYSFRSGVENTADNNPLVRQGGIGLVNTRLSFSPVNDDWKFALYGTNINDVRYLSNGLSTLDTIGVAEVNYSRPREWGVEFQYSF